MLLRALVEAEIDGVAVANQLTALKETIDSLAKVNWALNDYAVAQEEEGWMLDGWIYLFSPYTSCSHSTFF